MDLLILLLSPVHYFFHPILSCTTGGRRPLTPGPGPGQGRLRQAGRQAQCEAQTAVHAGGPAEGRQGPHHRLHHCGGPVQSDVWRGPGRPPQSQTGGCNTT